MAENNCKDAEHASDVYVELKERDDDPEQAPKYPLELFKIKDSIIKEVLEAINQRVINHASYVGGVIGPPQNSIKRVFQPGMKRPYPPPVYDTDSVSLHVESCSPLVPACIPKDE